MAKITRSEIRLPRFKNPDGILKDGRHYFKCPLRSILHNGKYIQLDLVGRDKGKNRIVFVSNGEFRGPKEGEYYFSGDTVWESPNDLTMEFWIAIPIAIKSVTIESEVPIQP